MQARTATRRAAMAKDERGKRRQEKSRRLDPLALCPQAYRWATALTLRSDPSRVTARSRDWMKGVPKTEGAIRQWDAAISEGVEKNDSNRRLHRAASWAPSVRKLVQKIGKFE